MFEKILVPLDGSGLAQAVLPLVKRLAGKLGSSITLLHVVEEAMESQNDEARRKAAEAMANARTVALRYLEETASLVRSDAIDVESVALNGSPYRLIAEYPEAHEISLIAMATHGRAGLSRAMVGSIATRVIQGTSLPVLLVRPHEVGKGIWSSLTDNPTRILVPLDGSKLAEQALPYARDLAIRLNVPIMLAQSLPLDVMIAVGPYPIQIWNESWSNQIEAETDTYLAGLGNDLVQKGVSANWQVLWGRAAQRIVETARDDAGTLIVMTTHGRSGWQRWMMGSVADEVMRETGAPTLIIKSPGQGE